MPINQRLRLLPIWSDAPAKKVGGGVAVSRCLETFRYYENNPLLPVPPSERKSIECVRCGERYSVSDVHQGRYRLETMVCSPCYAKMQKMPYSRSCFGKPNVEPTEAHPHPEYGYDLDSIVCRELCPDREVCRLVVLGPSA